MLLLCPGQGAQSPGLLTPWLDLPGAADRVTGWSARTGLDLLALGTLADAATVRRTEHAQPLIVAAALLSGRAVLDGRDPTLVCGHSVGELAALALAGVLTDDDAVALAAGRGAAMGRAADLEPTGMAAVLGVPPDPEQLRAAGLQVATVNAPGQVVVGGTRAALEAWVPPAGARLRPLAVAGAFHTRWMQPAVPEFTALLARVARQDARCPVVANGDGAVLTGGDALLDRLAGQLTRPVRFDLGLAHLADETSAVELAPAGVLTALLKRALPDLAVRALRSTADLGVEVPA